MCEWCDENGGEPSSCQNCGTMICWDHEVGTGDDLIGRPYVTASGDVYCVRCGRRADQDEQDAIDEEADAYGWNDYSSSWYDPDMDFENEDANGVYIGDDESEG